MARNAKQTNALVGAEVFSLAQQQFEKYGSRANNKPCDFNHISSPEVERKTAEREYRRRCLQVRRCRASQGKSRKTRRFSRRRIAREKVSDDAVGGGSVRQTHNKYVCLPTTWK